MKLDKLTPLKDISADKLRELFKKDSNFAWNVRHYAEEGEALFLQEIFKSFGDEVELEWEFGLYTKCRFDVNHDPASLRGFTLGCFKILKDYGLFDASDANYIDALGYAEQAYENCDSDEEDETLERAYVLVDAVARLIESHIRETFEYWESDEHVLNERMEDFIENYGEDIFLDPTDDTLVEVNRLKAWDF